MTHPLEELVERFPLLLKLAVTLITVVLAILYALRESYDAFWDRFSFSVFWFSLGLFSMFCSLLVALGDASTAFLVFSSGLLLVLLSSFHILWKLQLLTFVCLSSFFSSNSK